MQKEILNQKTDAILSKLGGKDKQLMPMHSDHSLDESLFQERSDNEDVNYAEEDGVEIASEVINQNPQQKITRSDLLAEGRNSLNAHESQNIPDFLRPSRMVKVFDLNEVQEAHAKICDEERECSQIATKRLKKIIQTGNYRKIPEIDFDSLSSSLMELEEEMPNFAPVIAQLKQELALAFTGPNEDFHISCICMNGVPGIGKTRFCEEVAKILSCGVKKISMGALSANFEIVGSSKTWGSAQEGCIARTLIDSDVACPVILLDEIDKISGDHRFSPVPIFLDLLEPDSAAKFEDRFLDIQMDASKIIFLATSNEHWKIPAPLKSRMLMVDIVPPSFDQRVKIMKRNIEGMARNRGLSCSDDEIMKLAKLDIDLREAQKIIAAMVGRSILNKQKEIRFEGMLSSKKSFKMGFV